MVNLWVRDARMFVVLAVVFFVCGFAAPAWSVTIRGPITDDAAVFSPEVAEALDEQIRAHHNVTGVQMAVVTVRTTGGVPIEDFTLAIAERWGGGSAGDSDGVVYLMAIDDRRQRIEVGYGLEAVVQDGWSRHLLEEQHEALAAGNYDAAAIAVVDSIRGRTDALRPGLARPQRAGRILGMSWMSGYLAMLWGGLVLAIAMMTTVILVWSKDPAEAVRRYWWVPLVPATTFGVFFGKMIGGDTWMPSAIVAVAGCGAGILCVRAFVTRGQWSVAGAIWVMMLGPSALAINFLDSTGLNDPSEFPGMLLIHIFIGAFLVVPQLIVWAIARAFLDPEFLKSDAELDADGNPIVKVGVASSNRSDSLALGLDDTSDASDSWSNDDTSSSSDDDYSGGGGGFGGGGASSSW